MEEVGEDQGKGRSVHQNGQAALRHLGTQGIGALGGADAGKKGIGMFFQKRLEIGGLQHNIHGKLLEAQPGLVDKIL